MITVYAAVVTTSTAQARVIVDELVRCGVTDVVFCPGSRNAPLAFALHAADAAGLIRLHVRIDERTAGFLAFGLALRSGRPVPVCTTSGTAVANLHPAVLEASYAGVPLLAVTADRPPQLIGVGASQTIEQQGIFGAAVRLAVTGVTAGGNAHWRAQVGRMVAADTGTPPGPVHLNLPFGEPLVPPSDTAFPTGRDGPWTVAPPVTLWAPPLPLDPSAPTLVIAGAGSPRLDMRARWWPNRPRPPGARRCAPARGCSTGSGRHRSSWPGVRRCTGRSRVCSPIRRSRCTPSPTRAARPGRTYPALCVRSLPSLTPPAGWLDRWTDADAAASTALDAALPTAPVGLRLAREMVAALPDGATLVLGSSNPVRDVALAAVPRPGLTILANRGVAGIDCTVSTAIGAALAHDGPAYALMGDLTFLHDTTGLVIGPDEPRPDLTIVVLNDGGGGIFGLLEQGADEHSHAFERVFGTPHTVDLAALCAATGVGHVIVGVGELAAALVPVPGVRVVEVRADRSTLRSGHEALRATMSGCVSGV